MNESISLMVEEHENIRRMLRVLRAMCRSGMHGEGGNQEAEAGEDRGEKHRGVDDGVEN